MKDKNKFYVTTPIYYATARPHLGSLYSTVLADIAARWNKLLGKKVFFLTGTDEHGQKIAQAAQKAGMEPQKFVDSFIGDYKHIWKLYNIDYTRFIRTTEPEHVKAVQEWLTKLLKNGDIYKSKYEGWYCIPDETFVVEKGDQESPLCSMCSRATIFISEESYFFKLSKYQDKLLKFYKDNPDFVLPKERLNEVIKFVESGLKDLSISRTTVKWGIPFPGDEKHVAYVWADALLNYLSGVDYNKDQKNLEFWWPADLQVMGKDILRFHAVYWPAFLMASNLELPKHLLVHGWIKVNQQKMSKSLGNTIDPQDLYNAYGADAVRYYLTSQLAITHDAEFSTQELEHRISTDLANDLGNLLNRTIALAFKNDLFEVPEIKKWSIEALELYDYSVATINEYHDHMQNCSFHLALASLWKFISRVNAYFHSQEPWKITDKEKFNEVISATCHSLNVIGHLIWPVMPHKAIELLDHIGQEDILDDNVIQELKKKWNNSFKLKKGTTLFQKIEEPKVMKEIEQEKPLSEPNINFEDFAKVKLLVGTIEQCEEVPKSDKLYKLQVNFGDKGMRQILSGVRQYFKPQDLIGKQGVFVFNLAPRKMVGLESQGMMLFVEDANGNLQFVTVAKEVPNGNPLR